MLFALLVPSNYAQILERETFEREVWESVLDAKV